MNLTQIMGNNTIEYIQYKNIPYILIFSSHSLRASSTNFKSN